ncbi:MAG: glycosyltransferase [Planctomycetes bacterium]|nr:glycosyltransferase [Planctomycetota bacterium]
MSFRILWIGIFALAFLCVTLFFALYPLALLIACGLRRRHRPHRELTAAAEFPFVSLIIVVRNGEHLIEAKLRNAFELDYPAEKYEVIVFSDGSTDGTDDIVQSFHDPRLSFLKTETHRGKMHGLNRAVENSRGEILVFSDADALLKADAIKKLARHYCDPQIGGVSGRNVVRQAGNELRSAQASYITFDNLIKRMESSVGSLTSNNGKLHSLRRGLYRTIKPGACDDLHCCLSVVLQRKRFIFDPAAQAMIPAPSRTPGHELTRRRRIVCGSLIAMLAHWRLFNPLSFGLYGLRLAINKILRRLLPVSLLLLLASTIALWNLHPIFQLLVGAQALFYAAAAIYPLLPRALRARLPFIKAPQAAFYFCIGNIGMMLGLWDFLRGRRFETWEPRTARDEDRP